MNDENKNNENEKEMSFLDFLQIMGEMNKQRENEADHMAKTLAHHVSSLYKSFIQEGFTQDQAMDLVKCVISGAKANDALK